MTTTSKVMEQQVERIKRLLSPDGTTVTWNEKIPDPTNPKQKRQIDVTIRRDGKITHVECRLQSEVQDVGWIEELIGRRASLRADAIIAVSASGFTEGAVLKADAFGIILRTFATLSDDEIAHWGKATAASLSYYEFKDTVITFTLPRDKTDGSLFITKGDGSAVSLRGLFELIMRDMESHPELEQGVCKLSVDFRGDILVGGVTPITSGVETQVRKIVHTAQLVSVVAYSGSSTGTTYARVREYDKAFEVIDADSEVGVVVDLSTVQTPENCLFHGASFDFGRVVLWKWLRPIGIVEAMNFNGTIDFKFVFS